MLAVEVTGHRFTDDELRSAIRITFPGRRNDLRSRLQEDETVTGQAHLEAADGPDAVEVGLKVGQEFYLESRELAMAM